MLEAREAGVSGSWEVGNCSRQASRMGAGDTRTPALCTCSLWEMHLPVVSADVDSRMTSGCPQSADASWSGCRNRWPHCPLSPLHVQYTPLGQVWRKADLIHRVTTSVVPMKSCVPVAADTPFWCVHARHRLRLTFQVLPMI